MAETPDDALAQALRDYELRNDMRDPWETANEHVKKTWRDHAREYRDHLRRYGLQVTRVT